MINLLLTILAISIPPANDTRIVDQAHLLTDSQSVELATLFNDVLATNHVKLGLLTVTDLDDEPKAVAVRTLNYWQMSPDSMLLLVSTNPRKVFLQPGSNLSGQFTESTSVALIRDNIVPALKSGRYGAGILNGFHAVAQRLPGPVAAPAPNTVQRAVPAPTESHSNTVGYLLIVGLLMGVALLVLGIILVVRYLTSKKQPVQPESDYYTGPINIVAKAGETVSYEQYGNQPPVITRTPSKKTSQTVVINNPANATNDFTNGLLVGEMLNRSTPAPSPAQAPKKTYTPPPSPPRKSSSYSSDSGGGSSWDSSSGFDSSDSSGGGGSDW